MPPTVAQTAPAFADALAEASAGFGLSANAACRAEYEDRRVLLPPLPPVAQDFVEEIHASKSVDFRALFQQLDDEWTRSPRFTLPPIAPALFDELFAYKNADVRAFFQQLDDDWTRRVLPPPAPPAYDDWDWNKDFSPFFLKPPEGELFDFATPSVTPLAYDENDWPRRVEWFYAPQTAESDVLLGTPFTPSTAWLDEGLNLFAGNSGSLAALLVLDEFVNAPVSGAFGLASLGHSARFGFSISSFR